MLSIKSFSRPSGVWVSVTRTQITSRVLIAPCAIALLGSLSAEIFQLCLVDKKGARHFPIHSAVHFIKTGFDTHILSGFVKSHSILKFVKFGNDRKKFLHGLVQLLF